MTKAELLIELGNKYYQVETPQLQNTEFGINYYVVRVLDEINIDTFRDSTVAFWVENEGEVNEQARWQGNEPKPVPVTGFIQKVNDYMLLKINDGTIEGAFIENVDEQKEIAIVNVVMTDLSEQRRFVDRDVDGNLQHRKII